MFNLPWYAWLNVLALPCLWVYLMLEFALQGQARWVRRYTTMSLLAAAIAVFLHWNPALNELLDPLQIGLALLIGSWVVWMLVIGAWHLLYSTFVALGMCRREMTLTTSADTASPMDIDAAVIDLDAGVEPCDCSMPGGKAISSLFARDATLDESMQSVMALIGQGEDDQSTDGQIAVLLIHLMCLGVIMIPPMIMSLRLIS